MTIVVMVRWRLTGLFGWWYIQQCGFYDGIVALVGGNVELVNFAMNLSNQPLVLILQF